MNHTDALSVLSNTDKDKLLDIKGGVIENVQKGAISEKIKNKNYSGDIKAGSVTISRFINAISKEYGTARSSKKGTELNNKGKVTVNLDTHKEIVEEINLGDLQKIGIVDLVKRRKGNHSNQMIVTLDKAFFDEATSKATDVVLTETTIEEKLEQLIQSLEVTTNEYVDGVDREMMTLTLKPAFYGKLRNHIDTVKNANVDSSEEEIKLFHGVKIESNHRQTADAIIMVDGAIAQPVNVWNYDLEKIGLSNDYALELFYDYGTKAVAPDLIKKATLGA